MNETVKQDGNATEVKTFTQEEMDQIVGERLKRERAKYADYEALKAKADKFDEMENASKSELQKAVEESASLKAELAAIKAADAVREIRESVAKETGVPASLLTGDNEDDCKAQAKAILEFATPKGYPSVRDGGEAKGDVKYTPKQLFADWAEKAFS